MTKTEGSSARYCFSFIKFAQNFKKIEPMRKILLLLLCVHLLDFSNNSFCCDYCVVF